jgi:hypothetical protein
MPKARSKNNPYDSWIMKCIIDITIEQLNGLPNLY